MQAVSGAGYPGVASLDILGNIVPFIGGGEEEKIETETLKILGGDGGRAPLDAVDQRAGQSRAGHRRSHDDGVRGAGVAPVLPTRSSTRCATFRGQPQELKLPTAPDAADRRDGARRIARSRGSTPISATA